jgi:hypothetical protein
MRMIQKHRIVQKDIGYHSHSTACRVRFAPSSAKAVRQSAFKTSA